MADVITARAIEFIERHHESSFFLFFSTHDIHVPRVPHARFAGKSGTGPRGDAMVQTDWCVGALMEALERHGIADNTLVLFSSDNGPVLDDGYVDQANEALGEHDPNGPLRAGKYSRFEGGTRVPFVVRWPGRVPAGEVSDALFGQVDLAATLCHLAGAEIEEETFVDSRDARRALLGEDRVGRPHLIHEAGALALRRGTWKFIPGGGTRDLLGPWKNVKIPEGGALFDLSRDLGETTDVAAEHPDVLNEMKALLQSIRAQPDRVNR